MAEIRATIEGPTEVKVTVTQPPDIKPTIQSVGPQGLTGPTGPQGPQGLQGNQGIQGEQGPAGNDGLIQSVVAGDNISVDDTDPANPVVSANEQTPDWGDIGGNLTEQSDLNSALQERVWTGGDEMSGALGMGNNQIYGLADGSDANHAVNKGQLDGKDYIALSPAPSSDHTASGTIVSLTAAESLVFGDFCYVNSSGKLAKADADAIATSGCVAMATESIDTDATGRFLLVGVARDDSWAWTVGGLIYLSTTAGGATQTPPSETDDVIQVLGVATHADRMLFNPQLTMVEHA